MQGRGIRASTDEMLDRLTSVREAWVLLNGKGQGLETIIEEMGERTAQI